MSPTTTRRLLAVHRWCSIVVSLNFVILALTGLVLVFHEEIDHVLGVIPPAAAGADTMTIGGAIARARQEAPDGTPIFVFRDPEGSPGIAFVGFGLGAERMNIGTSVTLDLRRGEVLPKVDLEKGFSATILRLHAELFLGPIGRLLVGVIGLALVVAIVTGFLVYGPTMRRFSFGLLRRDRSWRTLVADIHKLLGAATFGWNLVVTATGMLLCLGSVLLQLYAATELRATAAAYASEPVVTDLSSIDAAIRQAEAAEPGRTWATVALPGSELSSHRHYSVLLRGGTGLESHMFALVMVDALAPEHVLKKELPWYLRAILVAEPLHFGNYGGLPLKIVWSLFTLVTLGLSVAGVVVFVQGRRRRKEPALAAAT